MSEEEKEAIKIVEDIAFVRGIRQDVDGELEDLKALEDVLRLIDKLQKEIEEKQTIIYAGAEKVKQLQNYMKEYLIPKSTIKLVYISKDKIRNKIEEIDEKYSKTLEKDMSLEFHNINAQRHNAMKLVLEELLGE